MSGSIGRQIAHRCHVSMTAYEVIREVRKSMIKKARWNPRLRAARKAEYVAAIAAHKANQKMFDDIARGRIG